MAGAPSSTRARAEWRDEQVTFGDDARCLDARMRSGCALGIAFEVSRSISRKQTYGLPFFAGAAARRALAAAVALKAAAGAVACCWRSLRSASHAKPPSPTRDSRLPGGGPHLRAGSGHRGDVDRPRFQLHLGTLIFPSCVAGNRFMGRDWMRCAAQGSISNCERTHVSLHFRGSAAFLILSIRGAGPGSRTRFMPPASGVAARMRMSRSRATSIRSTSPTGRRRSSVRSGLPGALKAPVWRHRHGVPSADGKRSSTGITLGANRPIVPTRW